ncbi:hypothetical protein GYH30_022840 [Glycine max]|nr:hypothetical protein GYH30_022840 [Glycine max]
MSFRSPIPRSSSSMHRTIHEMEKTLVEFCLLHDYQLRHLGPAAKILTLDLSSRNDLCINPWVLVVENRDFVSADAGI